MFSIMTDKDHAVLSQDATINRNAEDIWQLDIEQLTEGQRTTDSWTENNWPLTADQYSPM